MNNWRLLLLAVVAVFQPIASFTDSHLIDGRQQRCDRLSTAPLQDTRSSLHGTYRLYKTTSALRRLNDRHETREDRRYELRQRVSTLSRPSSERPLVDIRGRVARQSPSEIARSSRVEFRLERSAISQSRERLLDVNQREETTPSTRDLQTQDLNRRVVDRTSRDALERRNVRIYTESVRDSLFRNYYRTERFGNERLSKNLLDSQREMQRGQFRSVERRVTLNRDARVLSRTQNDLSSIEASNNMNNQRIARERSNAVRRESTIRPDTRRNGEQNDVRRDLQRNNEQRKENTRLDQIRDMRIRNAREDNRENRQRDSLNQRLSIESFEERHEQRENRSSKQHNKENIDRSASSERRMQVARRISRESRIINVMTTQNDRNVDLRREIRYNERMSREIQDGIRENPDDRLSRERILVDRRNIRESRIMNARNKRDVADERLLRHNERMTRETRDENKENREEDYSREITQMDRRNIREMMKALNKLEVDGRREIRHNERMTRASRDENRENREEALSNERIQMDRRNILESRMMEAQNEREVDGRSEIRHNERLTRETRKEIKETLSRERIPMDRRNIRESRIMNSQNTRYVADRREIGHNERMTRESRDENRENREEALSSERIHMDRKNIRESRIMNSQNTRYIADRREIRHNERMTRETRDKNRGNREEELSRERIQMDRRNILESRMMEAQNEREVDGRREIRHNERLTRETRKEIKDNLEPSLSRERILDRRYTRDFRNTNTRKVRNEDDRREIRHSERNTRDERENHFNRHSVQRTRVDQSNIREFRVINNFITRDEDRRIDSKRETKFNNRMSRETRDENRVSPDHRLSLERVQMERTNIREFRSMNTPNDKEIDNRWEIRYSERSTELRKTLNPEQRISRERIQMDRRDTREFRKMNIFVQPERDTESRREMRTNARLHSENRENLAQRLSRERVQMDRRYNRESRIGNTLRVKDRDNRQQISYNERSTRETRDEFTENPDRRIGREIRQVDLQNIRESRVNRVTTRNERSFESDAENRREIKKNERLSGHIRGDQITRERRVESRSADRVMAEDKDGSMMDRRTRSGDRPNFREIRSEPRLSRSTDSERTEVFRSRVEYIHKTESRERDASDARSRSVEMARNRERISSVMVGKMETENDYTVANWQYILYTLQAAYLCALFMQMVTPRRTEKAHKMSLHWLPVSSHYNPIKVD